MAKKDFYINPLYFDMVNLFFINLVFIAFYKDAVSGPLVIRAAIGTPIVLLSFYFESISHQIFEKPHSHPEQVKKLVTEGIYATIRHPIYLGRMSLNLGFLVIFPIWPMLVVTAAFIIVWYIIAFYEELILIRMFGKRYKEYRKKVPMFIPK